MKPSAPHTVRLAFLLAALLFALTGIASVSRAESLEVIQLQHRMAEDLLPILQPLLPPGSVLTGTGDVLLVRTDPATLDQLRATVMQLDRAPRQAADQRGSVERRQYGRRVGARCRHGGFG